jgi:hypothetical protein
MACGSSIGFSQGQGGIAKKKKFKKARKGRNVVTRIMSIDGRESKVSRIGQQDSMREPINEQI